MGLRETLTLKETLEAATPGPWEACTDGMFPVVTKPESYATVMEFSVYGKDGRPEAEANAHLVALAPELAAEVLELRERHREAMALALDMGEELRAWLEMSRHAGNAESPTTESLLARLDQIGAADETQLGKEQT